TWPSCAASSKPIPRRRSIFSPCARPDTDSRSSAALTPPIKLRECVHDRNVVVFSPMTDSRPPTRYKVGLVQMAMSADAEANVQRAVANVAQAAAAGAQLVCLPELFRSQYFAQREDPELFDLAEPVPGPSTEALGTAAKQANVVVIAPVFERRAAGLYHNSAVVIDADGHVVGVYRKMHIPDDPAYD